MNKTLWSVLAILLLAFTVAYAANSGPEKLSLDGGSMGKVMVPHHLHQNTLGGECNACHSLFPQEQGIIDQLKADGKLKRRSVMNKCIACHKERKAKGEKAGPVKCSGCHA